MPQRWTELDMQRICWENYLWPEKGEGWDQLRMAVDFMRALLLDVDAHAATIEHDRELSVDGKARRLAAFGEQMTQALQASTDQADAEKRVTNRIAKLEDIRRGKPPAPNDFNTAMLGTEIRNHLLQTPEAERERLLVTLRDQPAVAAAIGNAPPFLSGISQERTTQFVEVAREALFPLETAEIVQLRGALDAIRKAATLAETMIAARCGLDAKATKRPNPLAESHLQVLVRPKLP